MARLNSVQTKLATEAQQNPAWQSVISAVQFNAFGAVTSLNHLGVTESRSYNVLGQMTRMTKGSLIDVEYRFSATANDGKILSQKNWLSGEDVTYQYDELERLISASTTAGTNCGLSWSFDGFSNRLSQTVTQGTGPSSVTLVNGNMNRISSAGYAYDSNGNMTQMPKGSGSMTLDYDLSNRVSGVSHPDGAEQYRYAPDNRRVWRSAGRTACYAHRGNDGQFEWVGYGEGTQEQVILYSPGGQKMGAYCVIFSPNLQYSAVTASEENVYYGGRLVGKRLVSVTGSNNGLVSDFTADRLQSKGNGSNYYPYGESKTSTAGDDREGFATYTRDEKSGLDYADQRWYASGVGRFGSVDPNIFKASTNRSGSWNAYAYTESNPTNESDPRGLAGEGCGTWWEGASDFGKCGGGGSSSPAGCDMTRAGCVEINGFALVSCVITDPTSSMFGSVGWCTTTTGGDDGDAVGGQRSDEDRPLICRVNKVDVGKAGQGIGDDGLGYYMPFSFTFGAGGGDGSYKFTQNQIVNREGYVLRQLGNTETQVDVGLKNYIDKPLKKESSPNNQAVYFDAPGFQINAQNGTAIGASYTSKFSLRVKVKSGNQEVNCPIINWQITVTWAKGSEQPTITGGLVQ